MSNERQTEYFLIIISLQFVSKLPIDIVRLSFQNIFASKLLSQKQQKVAINTHKWSCALTYLLSQEIGDGFKMLDFWKPNASSANKINHYIYILQSCHKNRDISFHRKN